jgi:hypothetical protein
MPPKKRSLADLLAEQALDAGEDSGRGGRGEGKVARPAKSRLKYKSSEVDADLGLPPAPVHAAPAAAASAAPTHGRKRAAGGGRAGKWGGGGGGGGLAALSVHGPALQLDADDEDDEEEAEGQEPENPYGPRLVNAPFNSEPEPLVLQQDPLVQVPAAINRYLRSYQRQGVKFLAERFLKRQDDRATSFGFGGA